eukprot:scaffold4.g4778.t1
MPLPRRNVVPTARAPRAFYDASPCPPFNEALYQAVAVGCGERPLTQGWGELFRTLSLAEHADHREFGVLHLGLLTQLDQAARPSLAVRAALVSAARVVDYIDRQLRSPAGGHPELQLLAVSVLNSLSEDEAHRGPLRSLVPLAARLAADPAAAAVGPGMARLPGAPDSEGLEEVLQAELFTFLSQVLDTDAAREAALAAAPALLGAAGRWVKEGPGPDGYDVPPPAPPGTANRFTAALRFLAAFSALVPFVTHPRYGQRVCIMNLALPHDHLDPAVTMRSPRLREGPARQRVRRLVAAGVPARVREILRFRLLREPAFGALINLSTSPAAAVAAAAAAERAGAASVGGPTAVVQEHVVHLAHPDACAPGPGISNTLVSLASLSNLSSSSSKAVARMYAKPMLDEGAPAAMLRLCDCLLDSEELQARAAPRARGARVCTAGSAAAVAPAPGRDPRLAAGVPGPSGDRAAAVASSPATQRLAPEAESRTARGQTLTSPSGSSLAQECMAESDAHAAFGRELAETVLRGVANALMQGFRGEQQVDTDPLCVEQRDALAPRLRKYLLHPHETVRVWAITACTMLALIPMEAMSSLLALTPDSGMLRITARLLGTQALRSRDWWERCPVPGGAPYDIQLLSMTGVDELKMCDCCGWHNQFLAACQAERVKLLLCSGCRQRRYCSAACQARHWRAHKPFCRARGAAQQGGAAAAAQQQRAQT